MHRTSEPQLCRFRYIRRHLILHTCIATVSSELWHLSPLVCVWVVSFPTTQFVRMAIGPTHHVKLTLIG